MDEQKKQSEKFLEQLKERLTDEEKELYPELLKQYEVRLTDEEARLLQERAMQIQEFLERFSQPSIRRRKDIFDTGGV